MEQLIQKMSVEMKLRGLSERSYLEYEKRIKAFEDFCGKPLTEAGEEDIKAFLHYLITEKRLAASSVNLHSAALKFLYQKTLKREWNSENIPRVKKPKKLPDVLTKEEVQLLFDVIKKSQA